MKKKITFLSILTLVICSMCLLVGCNETPDNGGDHVHSYNNIVTAPTCTEQGFTMHSCTCGNHYIDSYTDALGHSFIEYVSNNDATYEKDGTKTATCERTGCGVTNTITDEGSKLIEGHTHNYSSVVTPPTCTEKGFTTHTCSCNHSYTDSFTDALTHSFTNYISDENATYEADGTKTAVCDRDNCDETNTIADVGSKLEPLTIQFIADGHTISTQSFTSNNKNITIPDCPAKEGFVGRWENFVLGEESVVVNAVYIQQKAWDGVSLSDGFWAGDGSEARPYLIATPEQLRYFANSVNSGNSYDDEHIMLCANLDLGGNEWIPIGYGDGTEKNVFKGFFNGSDFAITNYKITESHNKYYTGENAYVYVGLFGRTEEAAICNLKIKDFAIDIEEGYNPMNYYVSVGGIAGLSSDSFITNCVVDGNINVEKSGYSISGSYYICRVYIGGIAGRGSSEINNVSVSGEFIGESQYVYAGGIIGFDSWNIENATFDGSVEANANDIGYAGGICGIANHNTISHSAVSAKVQAFGKYDTYCGGVVGEQDNVKITGCLATATLVTNRSPGTAYMGGISGYMNSATDSIDNCFTSTIVDIDSTLNYLDFYAGGIAGYVEDGSITHSITNGDISIQTSYENAFAYAGGIAGFVKGSSTTNKVVIENCVVDVRLEAANGTSIDVAKKYLADYCSIQNVKQRSEMTNKDSYKALGFKEYVDDSVANLQNKNLWVWDASSGYLYLNFASCVPTRYTVKIYLENLNGEYDLHESKEIAYISGLYAFPEVEECEGFVSPAEAVVLIAKDGSTTVEYKYSRKIYTIYLEGNGGNGEYIYPKYQQALNLGTLSAREGYTFGGWFFDAELTEEVDINNLSFVEGETLTLYAWWQEENKPSDFSYSTHSGGVWINQYIGTDRTVVIPSCIGGVAVSQISSYAFKDNQNILSLVIPDTVTTINANILQGCTNISSLSIPFVGKNDRTQYSYLDTNYILGYFFETQQVRYDQTPPEGWTKQGTTIKSMYEYGVYSNIPASLNSITITGDAAISAHAFYNCKNIKSFTLNEDITIIGEYAFCNSGLSGTLYLPQLVAICEYAFDNTDLSYIHLPLSVTQIAQYAFIGSESLIISCEASVAPQLWQNDWDYGVSEVYWGVTPNTEKISFTHTEDGYVVSGLIEEMDIVSIPNSFNDGIHGEAPVVGIDDYAFYQSSIVAVITPSSLEFIGGSAFKECDQLVAVILNEGLLQIDSHAFRSCSALSSVVIPSTVQIIGERAFEDAGIVLVDIKTNCAEIGAWAFYSCDKLVNVKIAEGTTQIFHGQFEGCKAIKEVLLPDSLTVLGFDAFMSCSSLEKIYIPSTVAEIKDWAFYNCQSTLVITYGSTEANWRKIVIGTDNDVLYVCTINFAE